MVELFLHTWSLCSCLVCHYILAWCVNQFPNMVNLYFYGKNCCRCFYFLFIVRWKNRYFHNIVESWVCEAWIISNVVLCWCIGGRAARMISCYLEEWEFYYLNSFILTVNSVRERKIQIAEIYIVFLLYHYISI